MPTVEMPLCPQCKRLLKDVCNTLQEFATALGDISSTKSDFDHVTKTTPESCLLCFCMRHLLPVDLPQSIAIKVRTTYSKRKVGTDYLALTVEVGKERVLGKVKIGQQDVAELHYEPAPTVDFQAISRLLHECEEQHNHRNWSPLRYQVPTTIQLVDVVDMMITPANTQRRYVALSYVWGGDDSFATTTKNIESLGHTGGLNEHMHEIPQTIKDAMDVVRTLGERYLWVDRLCIEQDNTTQKEAHIQKMDVIYSHALITIIAHAGVAATSPLAGLRPGTRLGLPKKRVGGFVVSVSPASLWMSGAPHETRGWTLQEQLMSKRCLYFDFHTTWFQCDKGTCREIDAAKNCPYELLPAPYSFNMNRYGHDLLQQNKGTRSNNAWKIYATIVERYRTRELRYTEDTVLAIQGITQVITDSLGGPLISAMPFRMLPLALQFYFSHRSHASGRNRISPSWSWAGWKDSVFFDPNHDIEKPLFEREADSVIKIAYYSLPHIDYLTKVVPQQPGGSEAADPIKQPFGHAAPYTLLEIKCSYTKASEFSMEPGDKLWKRGVAYSLRFYILDQWGTRCGYSLGQQPRLLEEDYHSDQFLWILLSKSGYLPMKVGLW